MQIIYSARFEKKYRKLSEEIKSLAEIKESVFINNIFDIRLKTHKLHGEFKNFYAFSINNKYRIIFEFLEDGNIKFHYVGTHDIYE